MKGLIIEKAGKEGFRPAILHTKRGLLNAYDHAIWEGKKEIGDKQKLNNTD